jgi:hypothetical protein
MAMGPRRTFDPTRRRLLLAGAGSLALAACGGGDEGSRASSGGGGERTTTTAAGTAAVSLSLLRVFAPEQAVGVPVRLPLAFAGADGVPTDAVPERITVRAVSPSGAALEPVEVGRRSAGIPSPYFPYEATFEEEGRWELGIGVGGAETSTELTVRPASDLGVVPGPGDRLPSIPTPTTVDALGIDPLCTAQPQCPLHETSLVDAMATGMPVVLLVSTPAFCQTAICGPVLELLVERAATLAQRATLIHVEVYADETARETSPTVAALGLRHEPSLFLADAGGTVRRRLDYTFDATELDDSLAGLLELA